MYCNYILQLCSKLLFGHWPYFVYLYICTWPLAINFADCQYIFWVWVWVCLVLFCQLNALCYFTSHVEVRQYIYYITICVTMHSCVILYLTQMSFCVYTNCKRPLFSVILLFPSYKGRAFKHTTMKQWNTQYASWQLSEQLYSKSDRSLFQYSASCSSWLRWAGFFAKIKIHEYSRTQCFETVTWFRTICSNIKILNRQTAYVKKTKYCQIQYKQPCTFRVLS